jgi:hypothetical protein
VAQVLVSGRRSESRRLIVIAAVCATPFPDGIPFGSFCPVAAFRLPPANLRSNSVAGVPRRALAAFVTLVPCREIEVSALGFGRYFT